MPHVSPGINNTIIGRRLVCIDPDIKGQGHYRVIKCVAGVGLWHDTTAQVFTARRNTSAVYAVVVCLFSVYLSVCHKSVFC